VSFGARFTFFSDKNPTKLYYDINGFIPSLWPDNQNFLGKVGLFTSVDENNFEFNLQQQADEIGTKMVLDEPWVVSIRNRDSVVFAKNSYLRTIISGSCHQVRLSIYPLYKMADNLFFSLQFESIYGSTERVFTDVLLGSDTVYLPIDSLQSFQSADFPYKVCDGYSLNSVSTFTGIGILLNYRIKNLRLQILPSVGIFTNVFFYTEYDTHKERAFTKDKYIACRFSLTDSKAGIKIGGDVRGLIADKFFSYSLYLSKQVDFKTVGDLLGSR
jgi:hypothetical protein